jgi:hypothetical protein
MTSPTTKIRIVILAVTLHDDDAIAERERCDRKRKDPPEMTRAPTACSCESCRHKTIMSRGAAG